MTFQIRSNSDPSSLNSDYQNNLKSNPDFLKSLLIQSFLRA